jgi:hypothetical protein
MAIGAPPILFLDIDGVLNSARFLRENPGAFDGRLLSQMLDPSAVGRLQQLALATDADVVISSSWRIVFPLTSIAEALAVHGFTGRIVGATGTGRNRKSLRGLEIQAWLEADRSAQDKICILDDDSDMGPMLPFLVKTTFEEGLLDEHVDQALRLLL